MAHLEIDVTPTGYVLHRVTDEGAQMLERFNTDEQGTRKLLATLHQELDGDGAVNGIVLAENHDPETARMLRKAIDNDQDAGPALLEFTRGLGAPSEHPPRS